MNATVTHFEATCDNIKRSTRGKDNTPTTEVEINIPYGSTDVYSRQSGGTTLKLVTVNEDAAAMFKVNGKYKVTIEPVED